MAIQASPQKSPEKITKQIGNDALGDMLLKIQKLGEDEDVLAIAIAIIILLISFVIAFSISHFNTINSWL